MREKKALSTAIMLLLVSVSLLSFSSGFISLSTKKFDYALWCTYSDLSPEFLERLNLGRIDILVINSASVKTDNTITYSFTREQLDGFVSQVRVVNSNMKFYADIYSYRDFPDKSTPEKRQVIIDEAVAFMNYFGNRFDAIIDDTEKYVGTTADHLQYFSECSEVVETLGVPYYPWIYKYLPSTLATRCAVGLYGSHAYYETEWKSAFERV